MGDSGPRGGEGLFPDWLLSRIFRGLEDVPSFALAVSGGSDSVALMYLVRRWAVLFCRKPTSITVLTVDHGLRAESADEARLTADWARTAGFEAHILKWEGPKPQTAIQAAAREARYGLLTDFCRSRGISALLTAHTLDDQAETFLLRLKRGSGLDGLAAMERITLRDGVTLWRPLLEIPKVRLMAYLRWQRIPFISDPSNENMAFERVRLRYALRALSQAGIHRAAIATSAGRLGRAKKAIESATAEAMADCLTVRPLGYCTIPVTSLKKLPEEIALRILAEALALSGGSSPRPRLARIERIFHDIERGILPATLGGVRIVEADGQLGFIREYGRLKIAPMLLKPGDRIEWDRRFMLEVVRAEGEIEIRPLGETGLSTLRKRSAKSLKFSTFNRLALPSSPAIWKGGEVIAAPFFNVTVGGDSVSAAPSFRYALAEPLTRFLKRI
jgi:tRNA(Ile)-lysidine synthase